ncbi:sulfatase [Thermostilla marina]
MRHRWFDRFRRLPSMYWLIASAAVLLIANGTTPRVSAAERRPNVIFFLIDDMGWTDLSCMGSKLYETPHIDRLAAEGMRFTDAYAACTVCSPTRAAVMSGKYPARLHLTDWIAGHRRPNAKLLPPDWRMYLPLEETTLAEALKEAGYATAHIGKWHLGDPPYYPEHQGFDVNIGGDRYGQPASYFWPYANKQRKTPIEGGHEGEYLTDRLTDEALRFIDAHAEEPFFIYFAHYAVHTPLQAKEELIAHYRQKLDSGIDTGKQRCDVYAAMVHSVDESVGRIVADLDRRNLLDDTIIIFTSDNGGLTLPRLDGIPPTDNSPLRAGKGSTYEGGVRVPAIIRWPKRVPKGSVSHEPIITTDYYPTILDLAGLPPKPEQHVDGLSIVPLFDGAETLPRDAIYWHYPHYHPGGATPYSAVRARDWKLIEFFEDGHLELYNLKEDLREQHDLAAERPDLAKRLRAKLQAWRDSVGAQYPRPNPNYKPSPTK